MYKITETWEENSVTWDNQPEFSYIALDDNSNTSIEVWEDYEITSAIKEIVEDGKDNFGFTLKFPYEEDYKGARLRSSEAGEQSERPKLTITYNPSTDITTKVTKQSKQILLKKTAESLIVYIPLSGTHTITISDVKGRELTSFRTDENKLWYQIPISLSSGIHIISIRTPEKSVTEKFWFIQ